MAGYLIGEEGPLEGLVIRFEEGNEWILGRDPDESTIVLEDPMVSRKHIICHFTPEGYTIENLSSVNPATQNGKVITEEVLLKEGDILEIGTTFFRFTEENPSPALAETAEEAPVLVEEGENLSSLHFDLPPPTRWLLKVISGPNAGAEFNLHPNASYLLGKDPLTCDVVFHDLSVSREHARLHVDAEEKLFIEDLGSRNGTLVNGLPIASIQEVFSQDLIGLGTTSFLLLDREQVHETIVAPPLASKREELAEASPLEQVLPGKTPLIPQNWKEIVIEKKHLLFAGLFCLCLLGLVTASLSLFQSKPVKLPEKHEEKQIETLLKDRFPSVQFSFNEATGKLFLIGHVLTSVEKQELSYSLSTLPFIRSVEDTVIIDELVWENMNEILLANPNWQAVSIHSPSPGKFILRGYVQTSEQAEALSDYMNTHFPYLDLLETEVSIADSLTLQIESLLSQNGLRSITFNLTGGDLILSGMIHKSQASELSAFLKDTRKLPGIRSLKNFVIYAPSSETNKGIPESASSIDLSQTYRISGFSQGDNDQQFIIINAKIFSTGDSLDGMQIISIEPDKVLLEKDGIKFRINYNLQ